MLEAAGLRRLFASTWILNLCGASFCMQMVSKALETESYKDQGADCSHAEDNA